MDARACVERLLAALTEGDASEAVQAASDLLNFLISVEGMLATQKERTAIQLGLAVIADRCEGMNLSEHPGVSTCADCGSDNCCAEFAEGMES
jgi:hypothetical protein